MTYSSRFVVIFVDDQDAVQNTTHPRYMPNLHQHIRVPGVELENYFVTSPVCCPSRTNLWRGQFSHNTNFTDVLSPHGGYQKWKSLGIDKNYLPVWLQQAGYETYYVGKFVVDYSSANYADKPNGWTDIDALVLPYTFDFNTPGFSRNGAEPNIYPGQYSTDVIADKGIAQIKTAVASGKPFFVQISPIAPHTSTAITTDPVTGAQRTFFYPPIPAPRHWDLFADATLSDATPQKNLYEKDVSDKPAWIRALPLAQQSNRTYLEEIYRLRLRSLASVDELIGGVIKQLNDSGVLDNTYVIYTGDNGYHVGNHRFGAGKTLAYEEEIRVPFVIRGPGIRPSNSAKPTNFKTGLHVDFAPTVLTLAGVGGNNLASKALDGTPLGLYANDDGTLPKDYPRPKDHRNQFQAEFWSAGFRDELLFNIRGNGSNTWKAVRVFDEESGRKYKLIVSCTNERELYDLRTDPGELRNVYNTAPAAVRSRLEGLLAVLVVCKGDSCTNPWKVLHPDGSVTRWSQALDRKYDAVYKAIQPFTYKRCLPYYDPDNEVTQFRAQLQGRRRAAEVSTADSDLLSAVADATAADAGPKNRVVFEAPIEKFARPIPREVLELDIAALFNNADSFHWT